MLSAKNPIFERGKCLHTPFYCEEQKKDDKEIDNLDIVFISSDDEKVPMWFQKAQKDSRKIWIWDYHVICIHKLEKDKLKVYDLDCKLQFGFEANQYFRLSFLTTKITHPDSEAEEMMKKVKFRVIPAKLFLKVFSSDRSHMLKEGDGDEEEYHFPPPKWDCIQQKEGEMNMLTFKNMKFTKEEEKFGKVLTMKQFFAKYKALEELVEVLDK